MILWRVFSVIALLAVIPSAIAQEATQPAQPMPVDAGNWCNWSKMTGDWGGLRTDLAEKGITLDIDVTQVFQDNMHGGRDTRSAAKYSGSTVLELKLDTAKMGLWQGGSFTFLADGLWGGGIDKKVGSLVPVNLNAALPGSAEENFGLDEGARFMLSEFFYTHVLMEGKLILVGGKLWGARVFDTNVFANNHRTQFMNTALRNNVMIPAFLPYTTFGAGAIVNPTEWLSVLTAVADSDGRAKTTGFETAFHGDTNTTVIHEWSFKVKPCNLPGNQRVGFVWSSKDFNRIDPNEPFDSTGTLAIKTLGMERALKVLDALATYKDGGDNVMVYYNFDQYLYTEADDPTQGIGLFGRFGWARQDVNPAAHFYSIGLGGKGVIPSRDNDTCGLGYYFADLSNQLPSLFHSEQGVECYYNIQITPWLSVSPDFQVTVNPGGTDLQDVSLVGGVRMNLSL